MADIYRPSVKTPWSQFQQREATSGKSIPIPTLDSINKYYLDNVESDMYKGSAFKLEEDKFNEQIRQSEEARKQAGEQATGQAIQSGVGTVAQLAMTDYLTGGKGYNAIKDLISPAPTSTQASLNPSNIEASRILEDMGNQTIQPGYNGVVQGESSLSPVTNGLPNVAPSTNLGPVSSEIVTGGMDAPAFSGTMEGLGSVYGGGEGIVTPVAEGIVPTTASEAASTVGMGAGLGSSTSMATVPVIGALIAAGMATKEGMRKYAIGGKEEKGGPIGYLAEAAQHPVAAVLNPVSPLIDTGVIGKDSGVGKAIDYLGGGFIENKVMDWIGGRK